MKVYDTRIILPPELHTKIKAAAEREFRTIAMQVTYIVSEWAKHEKVASGVDKDTQE